ncbi:MAG: GNAT family N-acetyltransferase [Hyphomonas sp.]
MYVIREAVMDDAHELFALHQRALLSEATDPAHGFIRTQFEENQIKDVIDAGHAVVAGDPDSQSLIGYYALLHLTDAPDIVELKTTMAVMQWEGIPLASREIGYGTQTVVDSAHRRRGIGTKMFLHLSELLSSQFEGIGGSITATNPLGMAFNYGRAGVVEVGGDSLRKYVVFDIRSSA